MLLLLGAGLAHADENSIRTQIQAEYDRACLALHYKYLPGLLGMRAHNYQAAGPSGELSPGAQLKTLQQTLENSTTASETTSIEEFVVIDSQTVRTRIRDVIQFGRPHLNGKPQPPVVIRTLADDTWVLEKGQWKLQRDEVREQNLDNQ